MKKLLSVSLLTCMLSVPALAQVDLQVDAPWVRATVPQQRSTGMFARLTSPVYPGETIRTEMWRDGNVVSFRATVPARGVTVLNNGRAEITA